MGEHLLTEITSFFFIVGAGIVDVLERWTLALLAFFILFDLILGRRMRTARVLGWLQSLGLLVGYLWSSAVFREQDVAGPYASVFVVGAWFVITVVAHAVLALYVFVNRYLQR